MDKPLTRCPECKSSIRRVINGGLGVIFKGSGFYSTDNKKGSSLTGGNGGSSKDKDKSSDKSNNGSSEKSSSDKSSSEKSSAEKPSSEKTKTEKAPASS
jgi:predicted nucleic acid-binding Zn ribbon protein